MNLIFTIFAFIIAIGILVTVHEYGHYWVAKKCGVRILTFSIGFGKKLWSKKYGKDQTEWTISAIPLGGYVKMLDEREGNVNPSELHRSFNQQSVYKRIAIVSAGPIANLLLSILIYWIVFMSGVQGIRPIIGEVLKNTPASIANFQLGDEITSINGQAVKTWQDFNWILLNSTLSKQPAINITIIDKDQKTYTKQLNLSLFNSDDIEKNLNQKIGLTLFQPTHMLPTIIGNIVEGKSASLAGLKSGDKILEVNQKKMNYWQDFVTIIKTHPNHTLNLKVLRDNKELSIQLVPEAVNENNILVGKIGCAPYIDHTLLQKMFIEIQYNPFNAMLKSLNKTFDTALFSFKILGKMLIGDVSPKNLSGPLTIADYAGQSAKSGFMSYLNFLALISISIGVLNLLPIPMLDGGHLMYYFIEIVRQKPVSESTMLFTQKIGGSILIFFMALTFYNDIVRIFIK